MRKQSSSIGFNYFLLNNHQTLLYIELTTEIFYISNKSELFKPKIRKQSQWQSQLQ